MNKLTAIGFSILESRQKYVIAYEYRQSECIWIQTVCMNEDIEFYDTSNFDKNTNKPITLGIHCDMPGLLKDELENTKIKEGILMVQRHILLRSPTVKK